MTAWRETQLLGTVDTEKKIGHILSSTCIGGIGNLRIFFLLARA